MNTVSSSNGEVGWITQVEVRIQEVNRDLDYLLSKPNSSEFVTFLATVRARKRGASSCIALRFIYVASFSGECLDSSPKLSAKSILWLNRAHSLIPYQSQETEQPLQTEEVCGLVQTYSQANILQKSPPNYYLFWTLWHKANIFLIIHMRWIWKGSKTVSW